MTVNVLWFLERALRERHPIGTVVQESAKLSDAEREWLYRQLAKAMVRDVARLY